MPAFVTRTSILSKKTRTLKLELIEQEDLEKILKAYYEGIIPDRLSLTDVLLERKLSHDAIQFIIDGTTREETEKFDVHS